MKTYTVTLLKKESIAYKTISYFFSKPADLIFKSGQYLKLSLINPQKYDLKGNIRSFSIASTPEENQLMITFRIRNSPFKKELDLLPIGSEVKILAPITMFNLKMETKPVVFLTGGVGVAAVRPMILNSLAQGYSENIYLFNSNRNTKDIPYFDELKAIKNTNFHYIPALTRKGTENSSWSGERGYIDKKMLIKHVSLLEKSIFFLVGPPAFMWGMYKVLQQFGINEKNINFDEFTGY